MECSQVYPEDCSDSRADHAKQLKPPEMRTGKLPGALWTSITACETCTLHRVLIISRARHGCMDQLRHHVVVLQHILS